MGLLDTIKQMAKKQYQQGLLNQVMTNPASIGTELGQLFDPRFMSQVKPMSQDQAIDLALDAPMMAGTIKNVAQTAKETFEAAQRNASLPASKGGLGLPANNTAMDRAKAMGFDTDVPVYHGTDKSFDAFDLNKIGSQTSMPLNFPRGIYTSPNVEVSLNYGKGEGQNVIPLLMNKKNPISITDNITSAEAFKRFNTGDVDTFLSNNVAIARNPNQLRSINAAFDPLRRNEADILAGVGAIPLGLLNIDEKKKRPNEKPKKK